MNPNKSNEEIVCSSIGICHNLGTSNNGFAENLLLRKAATNHLSLNTEKLDDYLVEYIDPNLTRRIDKVSKMGLLASQICKAELGISLEPNAEDIGVIICNTYGGIASSRDFINSALTAGYKKASPIIFPNSVPNAATGIMTLKLGVRGFNTTISGFNPVSYAYNALKLGKAKAFFVGGIEEVIPEMIEANIIKDQEKRNTGYYISSMADSAAVIFLSTREFAEENNLNPLFKICGSSILHNYTRNNKRIDNFGSLNRDTISRVMSTAIDRAGITKDNINLILSLGGQVADQDKSELNAINSLWETNAPEIWRVKENIGETFGVSDTLSTIAGYYHMKNTSAVTQHALINSYQVGGNISSTVISLLNS